MKTKELKNCNMDEVKSHYTQGIISQAQYEAYIYIWENSVYRYSVQSPAKFMTLEHDAKHEMWELLTTQPMKIQVKISMAIRKELGNFEGCIFDSARGIYQGQAVIEFAESLGMAIEDERTPDHEFYFEAVTDAENWLNAHIAKDGFYFGNSEAGDFGYWRTDTYIYIVDLDERGEYRAHVEHEAQDGHGMIELDVPELIADGYMRNTQDMRGLSSYLKEVKLLPHDAELTTL